MENYQSYKCLCRDEDMTKYYNNTFVNEGAACICSCSEPGSNNLHHEVNQLNV